MGHMTVRKAVFSFTAAVLVLGFTAGAADGKYPSKPLVEGPDYQPKLSSEKLIKKFGSDKLIFIRRKTFHSSHFYTDFIDGCSRYGGNVCVLDLKSGKVTDLVPQMSDGIFDYLDLSFDAKKVVFGWKKAPKEGFRIYECNIDGTGLKQLTFRPADEDARIAKYDNSGKGTAKIYYHQTDDMHPCYLPDGGIIFTSTRCEYGTLCDAPDRLSTAVLHRMDVDGSNMEQLTLSPVSEFSPSVAEDGRIIYTRWEYVDKGQLGVKCLWSMYSDGSGTREVYGNDIYFPPTMMHGRQIPGNPNKFVMLGTPHFPQSGIGTVILVDVTKPIRTLEPMTYVTPWVDIQQEPGWNHWDSKQQKWGRRGSGPLYMSPYPLSEREFIVSHNKDQKWKAENAYGIWLIDVDGKHTPIYSEEDSSCWYGRPVKARKVPPVLAAPRDERLAKKKLAVCSVNDVYHGLEDVKRGEVKWIRIMEQIPRPWSCRRRWSPSQAHTSLISRGTALAAKALGGIVPVEKDGSAHFYVPADRNIYFSVLDENFMELQRERTYVNYRPGENRSCIGCHETPQDAPPRLAKRPSALAKPPVMPQPQPGDKCAERPIHYPADVQPVLDKYCVSCHKDLSGEMTRAFSRSYEKLLNRENVPTHREAADFDGTEYRPAKSIGSYRSKLAERLLKGCSTMEKPIPLEARLKITTWIDASGVYYGSYFGRIHIEHKGHPNFRPTPTFDQAISTVNPWEEYETNKSNIKMQKSK